MSVQITIRKVPEPVRDELADRAAREGKSMEEYLREQLARIAGRPSIAGWLDGVRDRKRQSGGRVSRREILRGRDADRR